MHPQQDIVPKPVAPQNLIGSVEAAAILKITKSTLTRHVAAGKIAPLATLPGPRGALIFDRCAIEAMAA